MVFRWFPCRFVLGLPQLSIWVGKVEDRTAKARCQARGNQTSCFISLWFSSSAPGCLDLWNSCANSACAWVSLLQSRWGEEGAWSSPCCGDCPTPCSVFREEHHAQDIVLLSTAAHGFLGLFTGLLHLPPWLKLTVRRWEIPGGVLHRAAQCSGSLGCFTFPWIFYVLKWLCICCSGAVMEQWWSRGAVPCMGVWQAQNCPVTPVLVTAHLCYVLQGFQV